MVRFSSTRTGAKCDTGPLYSSPNIRAKNRADASLSRAGTMVWSRWMVMRLSLPLSTTDEHDDPGRQAPSIRARHPQHVLAEIGEYQVGRDRRGLVEAGLAPFALDVVFL